MSPTHVKICCISSMEEAQLAISAGASAIGLVGPMPSGPGVIDDHLIAAIAETVRDKIETFLLTSERQAGQIVRHARATQTSTIQLVDYVEERELIKLREQLPGIRLIQVIHVSGPQSILEARKVEPLVDGLLLDSGNPNASVKTLGGTGKTHNWSISQQLVKSVEKPVYLAGGLNKSNVQKAIENVQPYGVDLCTGVRTNGHLDAQKLESFMQAVSSLT